MGNIPIINTMVSAVTNHNTFDHLIMVVINNLFGSMIRYNAIEPFKSQKTSKEESTDDSSSKEDLPKIELLNILNLDIILTIANFLPRSFNVENFCVNKFLKKNLQQIIYKKSIGELNKAVFAKPFYPKHIKQKIYYEERTKYKNEQRINVYLEGQNIGHVKRRSFFDLADLKPFWCGYYYFSYDKEIIDFDGTEIAEIVDFDEEITFCGFCTEKNVHVIGWDYMHWWNETIEGYQTLEATMNQVCCFHRKVLMNKKLINDKLNNKLNNK